MDYKKAIKESGLKVSWLAEQIGISRQALSAFINNRGNLLPENIHKLNKLLNIK